MRRPDEVERLYLDFDGFFAAVEQCLAPALRGRPVGVIPHETNSSAVIAVSREAKLAGVKTFMRSAEARQICPDILFVPQQPDMYRRAHNALIAEINAVLPIDTVKSIDELSCRLDTRARQAPEETAQAVKASIRTRFGAEITCSIGLAANRLLAKMACKAGKWRSPTHYGDGLTLWHPKAMPTPLLALPLDDVPGIGRHMRERMVRAGLPDLAALLATSPKQMRALWGNVHGESLWYALHGYAIEAAPQQKSMYGHSRVLDPSSRRPEAAFAIARTLAVKAARRLRRDHVATSLLAVTVKHAEGHRMRELRLPAVHDDHSILVALREAWGGLGLTRAHRLFNVSVMLSSLSPLAERQGDLLEADHRGRQRWERLSELMDSINRARGQTLIHLGAWVLPSGGNTGGKIAFSRVPDHEDFW